MLAVLGRILNLVTAPSPSPAVSVGAGGYGAAPSVTTTSGFGGPNGTFGFGGPDPLGVGHYVAGPLLVGAEYLIPAGVALAGLHKLLSHQETGAGFLVDMLIKGGGAILIIQLMKSLAGMP